ncbi:MAG: ankyrin repeat domain-containing protein [bacterium]|nr:ankyrin repeat domain-containing protein [bacterium]
MKFRALHTATSNSPVAQPRRKAPVGRILTSEERYSKSQEVRALFCAVKHKQLRKIRELLETKKVSPDTRGKYGDPSILIAAERGDAQTVECFLHYDADPNAKNSIGLTALMLAIRRSMDTRTIDVLLEGGAKLRARNYLFETAWDEVRWAEWLPQETKDKLEQRWVEEGMFYKVGKFFSEKVLGKKVEA